MDPRVRSHIRAPPHACSASPRSDSAWRHEMKARLLPFLAALLVAGVASVWLSPVAVASPPIPVTITETIDFTTDPDTFTASAPLCPSGTFVDTVEAEGRGGPPAAEGSLTLVISSVFTCADGSGTFTLLKQIHIQFTDPDNATSTGTFVVMGGTGAYATLHGQGTDDGTIVNGQGTGNLAGEVHFD
jgi:hypothetical protein